ncbi:MAG TPA: cupin [Anaerolineaceae bacterium]|nr:cupin [Anaerolineaceae bacterium]
MVNQQMNPTTIGKRHVSAISTIDESTSAETIVGLKIRGLRNEKRFSLKMLAERSGLNINTLSLIENSKSSPSVSTLQQLAKALDVPLSAFFESEPSAKRIVFTTHDHRPGAEFSHAFMQNLGKDLKDNAVQPFIVTLKPEAGSGEQMIVHTGHEFVYCLSGKIEYIIEKESFTLIPGDSLVFEAHLPHQWTNIHHDESQLILVLYPADQHEEPGGRHFPIE